MKKCKDTESVKGCGDIKPDTEFRIIRTNKTTGKAYRERLCNECRKKSRRTKKKGIPVDEANLYNKFNQLMG